MNKYEVTSTIRQSIFFLFFLCMAIPHVASAQLRHKSTEEPSIPKKYTQLKKGDRHSIQRMLNEGIPVDAVDEQGRTLLMQKAMEGDTICIKHLIKAGADINKRHKSGNIDEYLLTPLEYAILGKQKATIDLLRRNGALWEEERQKILSTILKLDYRINAEMLEYILTKGARLGEPEKLQLLVRYVTMRGGNVSMQREIVYICLRDTLQITPQKVKPYLNKWDGVDVQKICDQIIKLQEEEMEILDLPRRKAKMQDSLQRLIAEGREDTLHYRYQTYANGEIAVAPRIDTFYNKVGKEEWLVILLSALVTFLLLARLVRKFLKNKWKQVTFQLLFPMGAIWFAIGALFYLSIRTFYLNADDYCTRLQGQEYIAEADYRVEHIQVRERRRGYRSKVVRRYTFTFVAENGVTTCLNQGLCNFSKDEETERGDKLAIRYLPSAQKLSVADASNASDNLLAMGISASALLLMTVLLMGKLNFIFQYWKNKSLKRGKTRNTSSNV